MLHEPYSADNRALLQQKLFWYYYYVAFVSVCCFMFSSIAYTIMIFCSFRLPSQTDINSIYKCMCCYLFANISLMDILIDFHSFFEISLMFVDSWRRLLGFYTHWLSLFLCNLIDFRWFPEMFLRCFFLCRRLQCWMQKGCAEGIYIFQSFKKQKLDRFKCELSV